MCTSLLIGLFLAWPTIIKQSLSIIPCKNLVKNIIYYKIFQLNVILQNIIVILYCHIFH